MSPWPGGRVLAVVNVVRHPSAEPSADKAAIQFFRTQWETYRRIIEHNYLYHREAYAILHRVLMEEVARPFRFVDLACGDASASLAALRGTKVTHYHGVDLAEPALKMAQKNLEAVDWKVKLEHADFVEAIRKRKEPADVVWIGLSLHHLSTEDKISVLRGIRAGLSRSGLLLTYDPVIPDGETLTAYHIREVTTVKDEWTSLTPEERDAAAEHIQTQDRPETIAGTMVLAHAAGFAQMRELFVSPNNLWRMYCFAA